MAALFFIVHIVPPLKWLPPPYAEGSPGYIYGAISIISDSVLQAHLRRPPELFFLLCLPGITGFLSKGPPGGRLLKSGPPQPPFIRDTVQVVGKGESDRGMIFHKCVYWHPDRISTAVPSIICISMPQERLNMKLYDSATEEVGGYNRTDACVALKAETGADGKARHP